MGDGMFLSIMLINGLEEPETSVEGLQFERTSIIKTPESTSKEFIERIK
jgi:hypothetical protein